MSKQGRRYSAEFKLRGALEAAKGQQTISELAGKASLPPNQTRTWQRQLLESGAALFAKNGASAQQEAMQVERDEQIGRLKRELEWLKKKGCPVRLKANAS